MGAGWRQHFCTTIPRDPAEESTLSEKISPSPSPTPRSCTRLGFFSGGSNPTTSRLQTQVGDHEHPRKLECKNSTPNSIRTSFLSSSNPTSPRSPFKLSLFRNSFKFRSRCGICLNSVKTGQGTAIYTAECSHSFHFPCIATHVRSHGNLVCPVCNSTWKDAPLLAIHQNLNNNNNNAAQNDVIRSQTTPKQKPKSKPAEADKKIVMESTSSPRASSKPLYDDDESLLSPTSRIIPIPEADDEEAEDEAVADPKTDDVQEFQGFFVNPNSSSSDAQTNCRVFKTNNNIQVRILPESALLCSGRGSDAYVVALRVKAPPPPILNPSHRAPIDLVTVLDVSGSMTGAKLQMLKRAMRLVISSLGSNDRLSIIAFSASTKRLLSLKRMTAHGQRLARRVVDRLACGQGSSVGDALRKATKVLDDRREKNPVASVMLLSDGHDERVKTSGNHRQISSQVSSIRFAHIEIPVHDFGFRETGGVGQKPAEDAFAKCVGGIVSMVVQDLRIQLGFDSGSAPAEISAIYSCNGGPAMHGSASVRLGDLYAEEERELLVELRVPRASGARGPRTVISVRCLYKDPATQEIVYGRKQALLVPLADAVGSSSCPKSERLRGLFITTRAVAESRRLVEHNDYSNAHHLLASARALLMKSGSVSTDEYVRVLEAELSELHCRRQHKIMEEEQQMMMIQRWRGGGEKDAAVTAVLDENEEPLTPTSAWRAAEKLAKVAMMKKSLNRVGDLHGFENAGF
ncbi:E3 ubiquitin-protein ligase WAV3-like [Pyrus communis]|uniref:E3 ubiquitin-protein ligase WAV3-like n=1 Tax=Pyrus communis TaxID=23211 RepID=UPI0035BF6FB7